MKIERFGEQGREERGCWRGRGAKILLFGWKRSRKKKIPPHPLCPKGKFGGAGGRLESSELHEELGMERCRARCPLTGTKTFQGPHRGWQRHLGDLGWDLGGFFFQPSPQVTLRERLSPAEGKRLPKLQPGLVYFLLETARKIPLRSFYCTENLFVWGERKNKTKWQN